MGMATKHQKMGKDGSGYLSIAALDAGTHAARLYKAAVTIARELDEICHTCFGKAYSTMYDHLESFEPLQPNLILHASDSVLHSALRQHRAAHPDVVIDDNWMIQANDILDRFYSASGVAWRYHNHTSNPTPLNVKYVPLVARLRAAADPYKELTAMVDANEDLLGLSIHTLRSVDPLLLERLAACAGVPHELLTQLGSTLVPDALAAARAAL